jgi:two-component system chemotaxis sensor kinase CheA
MQRHLTEPRRGILSTIQFKLSAIIVALVVGIVALLAAMFITAHVRGLEAALREKARTYAELVARDVNSAVAFEDRQTAREVFEAISVDTAVTGVALYGATGALLESRGELEGEPTSRSFPGSLVVTRRDAVIRVLAPVVSREGPRGALTLDLSTASVTTGERRMVRLIIGTGVGAILLGLLAAWFIARSIARRLSPLARAAWAVASGDLEQRPVVDDADDEIGSLARSFNAMWAKLRSLLEEIRRSAHQEASRLEDLVQRRTAELHHRNGEMRLVLDNVEQGLITLDHAGRVGSQRSRIVESWFGAPPDGVEVWDWLMSANEPQRGWFETAWKQLEEDVLPLEVSMDQLPISLEVSGCCYALSYRPLKTGDTLTGMLVMITDQTALREGERAERERRELSDIVERFQRDREGLTEFFTEARRLVETVTTTADEQVRARALHTLKGNAAMVGLEGISRICHDIEGALLEGTETTAGAGELLRQQWNEVEERFTMFSGGSSRRFEADLEDYQALLDGIEEHAAHPQLEALALRFRYEHAETRLGRLAEQASQLAVRLGKGPVSIRVEGNDVRLPPLVFTKFWSASVHTIRNAVDHGLEDLAARQATGDPPLTDILLRASVVGDGLEIEIRDFGRGIDWERLTRSAARKGYPCARREDLIEALFIDGITTKESVTEVSGRGVGLCAAREACEQLGGSVRVTSEPGLGTSMIFCFPDARQPWRSSTSRIASS